MNQIAEYIEKNKQRFLDELFELLRIPSVSADPKHKKDMSLCAEALRKKLEAAGADKTEVCPTAGHPVVYGEKIIDKNLPTVIIYGHYDVQPAEPLDLWHTKPFEPEIRDGNIFGRGSSDDKGQLFMHVKAFEFMMRTKSLPCNVKFMLEGEEEVGSMHLGDFIRQNKARLSGDVFLISDTSVIANDTPSITVGLRGLSFMEVELTGPNKDLHSGVYGGAVANPANILCGMISSLIDEEGKITIPGFYDDVAELTMVERTEMAKAPFDLIRFKKELEVAEVSGEKGYSTPERSSTRPTLDVNGIWSGYTGEGAKTVLPSKAYAKISMRLVPHQEPQKIADLFTRHFKAIAPKSVSVKVTYLHGGDPVVTASDSPVYLAASKAMEMSFGKKPIPVRGGGSIPIVALFKKELGLDSILMGFGLDSDDIHSPNEKFGVFNFLKGIETIPYFFKFFAEKKG